MKKAFKTLLIILGVIIISAILFKCCMVLPYVGRHAIAYRAEHYLEAKYGKSCLQSGPVRINNGIAEVDFVYIDSGQETPTTVTMWGFIVLSDNNAWASQQNRQKHQNSYAEALLEQKFTREAENFTKYRDMKLDINVCGVKNAGEDPTDEELEKIAKTDIYTSADIKINTSLNYIDADIEAVYGIYKHFKDRGIDIHLSVNTDTFELGDLSDENGGDMHKKIKERITELYDLELNKNNGS